ncbi:MAG: cation transporter [Alphaproteobacteria bacterium]|nr:cation transporter [Alphaproteobacteria bacterium]MCW5742712.1 cation transporter [Alphaproteobacteria bacterium]
MSAGCCRGHDHGHGSNVHGPYRSILWIALVLNAVMFAVEIGAGVVSGSVSLLADALDFLGDAANYAVTLFVLGAALAWRARAALLKAASMGAFGLWVAGEAVWSALTGIVPQAITMGTIGALALGVNLLVALLLFRHRDGDSNMRSVWICSRNDAIGNIAVMAAAVGVFGTGTGWPDIAVAAIMASLALWGAWQVARLALGELREPNSHHLSSRA